MRRAALIVIVLLVICIVALLLFFLNRHPENKGLVLYGNVDVRQVDIGFRVPGQVGTLYFEEGDVVHKGALMASLDKTPYNNQVLEAIAALDAVKAHLENAEKLLLRREELIEEGGVSKEDLDNALASRNALRASRHQLEAELAIALDNLGYTDAYAPSEGILLTRIREPGTVVRAADSVYTLSVSSPVWIRAFVDEVHLGQVTFGMSAEVTIDMPQAHVYTGKVGFISPVAEFTPKTVQTTDLRTDLVYRLRIYVDNPDTFLKQGMPVTVHLSQGA